MISLFSCKGIVFIENEFLRAVRLISDVVAIVPKLLLKATEFAEFVRQKRPRGVMAPHARIVISRIARR
jgi:hypothetical protein